MFFAPTSMGATGWQEALQLTVERFKEAGLKVGDTTIKDAYARREKEMPEKARRPLTYSRHRRRPLPSQN